MLPTRNAEDIPNLDGRYGDEALLLLIREAVVQGTNPKDYQIKIFGGADMFPEVKKGHLMKIGIRNIDRVMTLLKAFHLPVAAQHVGGQGHRSVIFDVWSGHVWMKHERFNGAAA
jgi:chemotaxis protein CheD